MKLQHLQNKVLHSIGKFPRHMPVCDMQLAFQLLNMYDYITKLCGQQASHSKYCKKQTVEILGKGKARHRKYKRLRLREQSRAQPFK
jgi:hypothetical protein